MSDRWIILVAASSVLLACSPKVQVQPPKEPIVINLNVNIQHEVRVKIEKDVEELIAKNEELF